MFVTSNLQTSFRLMDCVGACAQCMEMWNWMEVEIHT